MEEYGIDTKKIIDDLASIGLGVKSIVTKESLEEQIIVNVEAIYNRKEAK